MRGKRFACPFERWLDRESAETLKREPSAESNKKSLSDGQAAGTPGENRTHN